MPAIFCAALQAIPRPNWKVFLSIRVEPGFRDIIQEKDSLQVAVISPERNT
jgi:hypothetical protein